MRLIRWRIVAAATLAFPLVRCAGGPPPAPGAPASPGKAAAPSLRFSSFAEAETALVEIEDRLNKLRSPFRSAETFWIEEIIDPRATRPLLCEFAELAAPLREVGPYTHRMRP